VIVQATRSEAPRSRVAMVSLLVAWPCGFPCLGCFLSIAAVRGSATSSLWFPLVFPPSPGGLDILFDTLFGFSCLGLGALFPFLFSLNPVVVVVVGLVGARSS
jgi:hypothetical protein